MNTKWIQSFVLSALRDVFISSPSIGDALVFDGTKWVNKPSFNEDLIFIDYEGNVCVDYEFNVMTGL